MLKLPQPPLKQDGRFDDWMYRLWKQNESAIQQSDSPTFADVIVDSLQFTGGTGTQGTMSWNTDEETLDLIQNTAVLQVGQEVQVHVKNQTGSTITNGTPVMATGTVGASGRITVAPMDGTDPANSMYMLGVATYDIADGTDGKVTVFGKVRGLDTSGYSEGAVLYISTSTAGQFQTTAPTTGLKMPVAFVINSNAINGTIMVRVTPINEISPDHNNLLNMQGGTAGEYYHLTAAEYAALGGSGISLATARAVATLRI